MLERLSPNDYPNLVEFIEVNVAQHGNDHADGFEYGLEIVLEGIERRRDSRPQLGSSPEMTSQPAARPT
jgi:hypothetical protein